MKYALIVDQKPHVWPEKFITGLQIKSLAAVDPSYGVWRQMPGPNDPEISDTDKVDLSSPGEKRFFTGKKTTTEGYGWDVHPS